MARQLTTDLGGHLLEGERVVIDVSWTRRKVVYVAFTGPVFAFVTLEGVSGWRSAPKVGRVLFAVAVAYLWWLFADLVVSRVQSAPGIIRLRRLTGWRQALAAADTDILITRRGLTVHDPNGRRLLAISNSFKLKWGAIACAAGRPIGAARSGPTRRSS